MLLGRRGATVDVEQTTRDRRASSNRRDDLMVMVAAAVGAAVKWFGSKRRDADDHVQGDNPIVRAMFKAVNDGEIDDLKKLIDDNCTIWINSEQLSRNDGALTGGPDLWADALSEARTAHPDVHWELYDELTGKDEGKHKIAIRFVSKTTVDGVKDEFEVACVGIVENEKLIEWHQVADQETYDRRRADTGEDAVGRS